MIEMVGTPSDAVADVLAAGRGDISTVFASFSARHPEGRDAEYIEWHSLDHRPEQHRLSGTRASLRLVSTPRCRAARAGGDERFSGVDHVMTYFFEDRGAIDGFVELSAALRGADRIPELLPMVERGVYRPETAAAAERVKVGADVLPWWPALGVYVLLEEGGDAPMELVGESGVAGVWSMLGESEAPSGATAVGDGRRLTYLWLDADPADTAERLRPHLERRWAAQGAVPLLAAPFHPVVFHDWDRYVP